MTQLSTTSDKIQAFITNHFPLAQNRELKRDESLLKNGIVDSMGVLDLVTYLEKEFKIDVADEELVPENFQSIDSLTAFVESKINANPG